MEERSVHLLDYVTVLKRRRWWLIVPIVLGPSRARARPGVAARVPPPRRPWSRRSPTMTTDVVKSAPGDQEDRIRAISRSCSAGLYSNASRAKRGWSRGRRWMPLLRRCATGRRSRCQSRWRRPGGPARTRSSHLCVGRTPKRRSGSPTVWPGHSSISTPRCAKHAPEHTSDFLAAQLGQSRDRLKSIEERLRQVKETYMGRLPEQTQGNLQMVGGLRQQQENTSMSLRSDEDRLAMIERQIEAMKGGTADTGTTVRNGIVHRSSGLPRSARNSTTPRRSYTEKHPEVQRLKNELAAAEAAATRPSRRPRSRGNQRSRPILCIDSFSRSASRAPPHPRSGACGRSGRRGNRRSINNAWMPHPWSSSR